MDADVAFSELELIYMKGTKAHSGFPEVSYGKFASILVSKGYRVARVEQTETPEMLKERNDAAGKGTKKDKVVTRELCSIMTKGTRTYCHLDDLSNLEDGSATETAVSTSMLVAIKEITLPGADSDDSKMEVDGDEAASDDANRDSAVVEYGITCIDTVLGTVTLAQFQDDSQRNRLRAFLARYMATEVLVEYQAISKETEGVIRLVCPKASVEYLRGNEMPSNAMEVVISILKAQYFGLSEVYRTNSNASEASSTSGSGKYISDLKKLQQLATSSASSSDMLDLISTMTQAWPQLFQAVLQGLLDTGSTEQLVISFGAALWQLKRSLIDYDVLSMGKFFGYVPPDEEEAKEIIANAKTAAALLSTMPSSSGQSAFDLMNVKVEGAMDIAEPASSSAAVDPNAPKYMVLDEVALTNLEVLVNNYDRSEVGSLWQFVNRCKTIGGRRFLRNWLCQPLFQIPDIEKRRLAVRELIENDGLSLAIEGDVKRLLKQVPDLERLLLRAHVNGLKRKSTVSNNNSSSTVNGKLRPPFMSNSKL
jgi:DNA mismatch repair protein MSH6